MQFKDPSQAAEAAAVPVLVLTKSQDNVEAINATLRKAGHAVHCTWVPTAGDLAEAFANQHPELLLVFADDALLDAGAIPTLRECVTPPVPVVLVAGEVDEARLTAGLRDGAQDVVTLANTERLTLACERELRVHRLERAYNATLGSARESQRALASLTEDSADAIVLVQEGIVVDVNPAWLDLLGFVDADSVRGQPLMDLFDADSHASLKGGLTACITGKWSDHALRVMALITDGSLLPVDLELKLGEFEGEPAVRCVVPARRNDEAEMQRRLQEAVRSDPVTGLLHRRYFVEDFSARIKEPVRGGLRFLACVRPDRIEQVVTAVGPLLAEDFMTQFASLVREQSTTDTGGRFTASSLMFLMERGTQRDAEAWADSVLKKLQGHVFRVGPKSISATATIGLCTIPASVTDPAAPVADVLGAVRAGTELGGNRLRVVERVDAEQQAHALDKVWVRNIKAALMENRFRLVQQPVASLLGADRGMFDVLVRMVDEEGKEVLPSVFLPAAERNDLMKNIDRWVIGASMSFCAMRKPEAIFVRLSRDTVIDHSLPTWLANQLKSDRVDPQRLCFQVTHAVAESHLLETRALRDQLHKLGFRFAIEHLGPGTDPRSLVVHLMPDFIKIDGSLMQGLGLNESNQQMIRTLVAIGKELNATTIAERVEDANTMAVLWQLGIEFIQGYFVQKPEEVVL